VNKVRIAGSSVSVWFNLWLCWLRSILNSKNMVKNNDEYIVTQLVKMVDYLIKIYQWVRDGSINQGDVLQPV